MRLLIALIVFNSALTAVAQSTATVVAPRGIASSVNIFADPGALAGIRATDAFLAANADLFSKRTSSPGITSNINGCDPAKLFSQFQSQGTYTGGITGCVTGDKSGNNSGIIAVQGFATSYHSGSEPVGGQFYGIAGGVDGVHAFGINPLVADLHDSSKQIVLTGEEIDVQPAKGPANYIALQGLFIRLYNPFNVGGTYRGTAITIGANTSSSSTPAYWSEGLTFYTGSIAPTGVALNVGAVSKATATASSNCPGILTAYEAYWNGAASTFEGWNMGCSIAGSGTNPNADYLKIGHDAGKAPTGQKHYFALTRGINLELDGAESGSAVLSAASTGGTLNLGSENATVTAKGGLSVTSCNGCGRPATLYSAAKSPLPRCEASAQGLQAVVSDASSPAYMAPLRTGGALTAPVICSFDGKSYSWMTH